MAEKTLPEYDELTAPANGDKIPVVDVSDTTHSAAGTTKWITWLNLLKVGSITQAWSAALDTWAGKTAPSGTVVGHTDTQTLTNKIIDYNSNTLTNFPIGWINYAAVTPTSGTLDDPSFELVFAGVNLSALLYAGMRVQYTQGTVKYGIITKVAFSTDTTVTIYGGTDYDLISTGTTAITAFAYATAKAPPGFPLDPTKWTVRVTDSTDRSQASAVASTWYNLGTTASQISIPIGVWDVTYNVNLQQGTAAVVAIFATLSTANNSESDTEISVNMNSTAAFAGGAVTKTKTLVLASKTLYYLNTSTSSGATPTIYNRNSVANGSIMIIEARCAYL